MSNMMTLPEYLFTSSRDQSEDDYRDVAEIVYSISMACSEISDMVKRASLDGHVGYHHHHDDDDAAAAMTNVQGERQKKLDVMANDAIKDALMTSCGGKVSSLISEEDEHEIFLDVGDDDVHEQEAEKEYVVAFDPLDGSSNVDYGIPVGTIFGVYERRRTKLSSSRGASMAVSPNDLVVAGYCLYSSATHFAVSIKGREGVQSFTLDETTADSDFVLTLPDVQIPRRGSVVSFNEANRGSWDSALKEYLRSVQNGDGETGVRYSSRYVGSMVADVHRTLQAGGLFGYPADERNPKGKLRLLYEAAPMAFLVERAGGAAIVPGGVGGDATTRVRILDIDDAGTASNKPNIHDRTPCVMGSLDDVAELRRCYRKFRDLEAAERLSERLDEYLAELEAFVAN